jgi:tRNA(Ile)-lysidine synthase TilS/MesJ
VTYLDRKDIHVIRPLIYTEEKEIKSFIKEEGIILVPSPCHVNGKTKRQYIKELVREMSRENRELKSNIFGAIKRSGIENW